MSMMAIMLAAQALPIPATPTSQPVADEIVVIARKLKTWKGGVYNRDGELACRIRKSTGDEDIDAIACGAMLRCYGPHANAFAAVAGSDLPKADREREMQQMAEAIQPCLDTAYEAGTRYLAEARAGER